MLWNDYSRTSLIRSRRDQLENLNLGGFWIVEVRIVEVLLSEIRIVEVFDFPNKNRCNSNLWQPNLYSSNFIFHQFHLLLLLLPLLLADRNLYNSKLLFPSKAIILKHLNSRGSGKITLNYRSSCQPTDFELVRRPKYIEKFWIVEAFWRDQQKNLNYRGFRIIEVWISEVWL